MNAVHVHLILCHVCEVMFVCVGRICLSLPIKHFVFNAKLLLLVLISRFMDKRMMLKLNGGRTVVGILRGFDPFMNVVIDETVEECRDGTRNNIGMVVSSHWQQTNCSYLINQNTHSSLFPLHCR